MDTTTDDTTPRVRRLVAPDDPAIAGTIGAGCSTPRALRARLRRAEAAGRWPRRIYLSASRYAYDLDEVTAALDALPRDHVSALGSGSAA